MFNYSMPVCTKPQLNHYNLILPPIAYYMFVFSEMYLTKRKRHDFEVLFMLSYLNIIHSQCTKIPSWLVYLSLLSVNVLMSIISLR